MGVASTEFPLLKAIGLYVKVTEGNGNCLFNALSDQLYGDQSKHAELRAGVIQHMRENADYYKQFIEVNPGGGTRRNPKRKITKAFSSRFSSLPPTQAEIDRRFEGHLREMARGGTYGDHMEISAFSQAYNVNVKIYQRDKAYMITSAPERTSGAVVHIAYHVWEHYSSIRNIAGPHIGPPQVQPSYNAAEGDAVEKISLMQDSYNPCRLAKTMLTNFPRHTPNSANMPKPFEKYGGNMDNAGSNFMDGNMENSASSAIDSSGAEPDVDSDDEEPIRGPSKRQNRRFSHAAKGFVFKGQRMQDFSHDVEEDQLSASDDGYASSLKTQTNGVNLADADETEEEDWRDGSASQNSASPSVSTTSTDVSSSSRSAPGGLRLKLSEPRRENARFETPSTSSDEHYTLQEKGTLGYHGTARATSSGIRSSAPDTLDTLVGYRRPTRKSAFTTPKPRHLVQKVPNRLRKTRQPTVTKQNRSAASEISRDRVFLAQPGSTPLSTRHSNEQATAVDKHVKVYFI